VNAYTADDSEKPTVIIQAQDFRLPEVLRQIEAGRIVRVIPATQGPRQPPSGK
jgi:hypothetical protein